MQRLTVLLIVTLCFGAASVVPVFANAADLAWPEDGGEAREAPPPRQRRPRPLPPAQRSNASERARARAERPRVMPTPKGRAPLSARANPAARRQGPANEAAGEGEGQDEGEPRAAAARKQRPIKNEKNTAKAKASPQAETDDDDDVEDVEPVEVAAPEKAKGADGKAALDEGWTFNKVLGHFHAAMVHLPIAWLMAWAGCEVLALFWRHPFLQMAGLPIGLLSALAFAPSVLSGLMRLDELSAASSGYDVAPALLHRNLNFVAWGLVSLAVILRLFNCHLRRGLPRGLYVALVLVAFGVMGYSAHLGGVMVYGEEFFPF